MVVENNIEQTRNSFFGKWNSISNYQIEGPDSFDSDTLGWIVRRNGFLSLEDFAQHLAKFPVILDAGCGNGRILKLMRHIGSLEQKYFGIDFASWKTAKSNLINFENVAVHEGDLTSFSTLRDVCAPDFIYCQEVLHHTSDPALSFGNLAKLLNTGGEIAIYVYKQKAPIREFTDDFVRSKIEFMSHDEAADLTRDFAEFGRALSELNVKVYVPNLRLLEIPAGTYDVQRLFYHFFLKCYWNSELSDEVNNMTNFDWYHPSLCSRHTVEEVRDWFSENNLEVVHEYVDEYGITMRGKKS
jgi:SAM-dependent methyltransferase